jgi:mono/diheme cytochrome c family protein
VLPSLHAGRGWEWVSLPRRRGGSRNHPTLTPPCIQAGGLVCALLLPLLLLSACDREERGLNGQPKPETISRTDDPRAAEYAGNAYQISQGQRLYGWMNCSGCHAHGGGGMGPPLSDNEWR